MLLTVKSLCRKISRNSFSFLFLLYFFDSRKLNYPILPQINPILPQINIVEIAINIVLRWALDTIFLIISTFHLGFVTFFFKTKRPFSFIWLVNFVRHYSAMIVNVMFRAYKLMMFRLLYILNCSIRLTNKFISGWFKLISSISAITSYLAVYTVNIAKINQRNIILKKAYDEKMGENE